MEKNFSIRLLRFIAIGLALTGAVGSLVFTLRAGQNNPSVFLVGLFLAWVLAPFIAMLAANVISTRWTAAYSRALYFLTIFLTVGSLTGYSGALSPAGTKPAFVFLFIPFLSWVILGIAALVARARK